jgi:carbohydrate-selective porin OprB
MRRSVALALLLWPAVASAAGPGGGAGDDAGSELVMTPLTSETPAYTPPQVEHLLGDLGGVRPWLENHGIYLLLDATAEFAGNTGGVKQGATSANQIGFEADIDWQRLAGITGLSTHVIMVNRSGATTATCSATTSVRSRRSMARAATWQCTWCRPMPNSRCSTAGWIWRAAG